MTSGTCNARRSRARAQPRAFAGDFRADRGPRPRKGRDPRVPADRDDCGRSPRSGPVAPGRPRPSPRRHANQQATDTRQCKNPKPGICDPGSRRGCFESGAAKPRQGSSDERSSARAAWAPRLQGPRASYRSSLMPGDLPRARSTTTSPNRPARRRGLSDLVPGLTHSPRTFGGTATACCGCTGAYQ